MFYALAVRDRSNPLVARLCCAVARYGAQTLIFGAWWIRMDTMNNLWVPWKCHGGYIYEFTVFGGGCSVA